MGPLTYINHLLVGLIVGFALGGKLLRIGQVPLRYAPLVIVLLALRVIVTDEPAQKWLPEMVVGGLLLALIAGMIWLLWVNRHIAGVPLMVVGIALNLLVMAANNGFMPVRVADLVDIGASPALTQSQAAGRIGHNVPLTEATALPLLADRIIMPAFFLEVGIFSFGDVLIGFGFSYLIICAMLGKYNGIWAKQFRRKSMTGISTERGQLSHLAEPARIPDR